VARLASENTAAAAATTTTTTNDWLRGFVPFPEDNWADSLRRKPDPVGYLWANNADSIPSVKPFSHMLAPTALRRLPLPLAKPPPVYPMVISATTTTTSSSSSLSLSSTRVQGNASIIDGMMRVNLQIKETGHVLHSMVPTHRNPTIWDALIIIGIPSSSYFRTCTAGCLTSLYSNHE
jgi:hypothetical protein